MLEWEKPELEQLSLFAIAQLLCSVVLLTNHELPGNILFQNGSDMILPIQGINLGSSAVLGNRYPDSSKG